MKRLPILPASALLAAYLILAPWQPARGQQDKAPAKPKPDLADVKYGPHERNVLDLWKAKADAPTPLVVFIHGGGFRAGDKGMVDPILLEKCLKAGISFAAINYRYSQQAPFPAPMHDSGRAIQLLRSKAKDWNLDPGRIGILGFSAGGHLVSTAATHIASAIPASEDDPIDQVSSRPDVQILIYPVITMGDKTHAGSKKMLLGDNPPAPLIALLSNEEQVTKETPPTFLVHTMADTAIGLIAYLVVAAAIFPAGRCAF